MRRLNNLRNIVTVTIALASMGYGVLNLSKSQVAHADTYVCCSNTPSCWQYGMNNCNPSLSCSAPGYGQCE